MVSWKSVEGQNLVESGIVIGQSSAFLLNLYKYLFENESF